MWLTRAIRESQAIHLHRGFSTAAYRMETGSSGARDPSTATSRLLGEDACAHYHKQGYWIEEGMFDKDEAALLLRRASEGGSTINTQAVGVEDAAGRLTKLSLFNTPGVNVFGAVSRTARMVLPLLAAAHS